MELKIGEYFLELKIGEYFFCPFNHGIWQLKKSEF
jgi:hypothetical protein